MADHTPGDWFTCGFENLTVNTVRPDGRECTIVLMPGGSPHAPKSELRANAALIAAAPAMLTALREALTYIGTDDTDDSAEACIAREIVRAAIAKATTA